MKHVRGLAALLLIVLLAACGSPTAGPPQPTAPKATSFSPGVASAGDIVAVAGTDLGTTGAVNIGGVPAEIVSWNATLIEARVAEGTPEAWQQIEVTTSGGSSALDDLFVGVEFTGAAGDLQDFIFDQATGSAILLGAEEYELDSLVDGFIIDNRSLYGRGRGQTKLVVQTVPVFVLADFGTSVTLADLDMEAAMFAYFHGAWDRTLDMAMASTFVAPGDALIEDPASLLATLIPQALEASQVQRPLIALRDFGFEGIAPGGVFGLPGLTTPRLDLELSNTEISTGLGVTYLLNSGNVTVRDSTITGTGVLAATPGGAVDLSSSSITGEEVLIGADVDLSITDSSVTALDSRLMITGAVTATVIGGSDYMSGPVTITDSTLVSLDDDLTDLDDTGNINIVTLVAPIDISDNALIRAHGDIEIVVMANMFSDGSITLSGNTDVRAGVFKSEHATAFRGGSLLVGAAGSERPGFLWLADNNISVTSSVEVMLGGAPGDTEMANLIMRGNTITANDDTGFGAFDVVGASGGHFELTNNTFDLDGEAYFDLSLKEGEAIFSGNSFLVRSDFPAFHASFGDGTCVFENNEFSLEVDDPAATFGDLRVDCAGSPSSAHRFDYNVVRNLGHDAGLILGFTGGTAGIAENEVAAAAWLTVNLIDAAAAVVGNTFAGFNDAPLVTGAAGAQLEFANNDVQMHDASWAGLALEDISQATVTGNTFTATGASAPDLVALSVLANMETATSITATGNTFTGFVRALRFEDLNAGTSDFNVTVTGNVFDFPIDAAPKVASLDDIKDEIDARNNVWGTTTNLADLQSYVAYLGDTILLGGDILLDPVGLP